MQVQADPLPNLCRMDEQQEKLARTLHARRRRMMAQELKEYLSPLKGRGLWAVIGEQPMDRTKRRKPTAKVVLFPHGSGNNK